MSRRIREQLEDCPVIAAVRNDGDLQECLKTDCGIVFILYGDIMNIASIVEKVREKGKLAMVHMDLVAGLGSREISVDFIRTATRADGIISTKPGLIRRGNELKLFTVMRLFVIDSMAVENIHRQCEQARPDCIEILPGGMPKVIRRIVREVREPVIAGGLITDKEDVMNALDAGAVSISTTRRELWYA
ncbi:MAG: glycerol-3-phosphate responsive antiterminator [bacterium]|nr:glycerol-3-phosphate responsive antiterminator [bacterium]